MIKQALILAIPLIILWVLLLINNNKLQEENFKEKVISENVINNDNTAFLVSSFVINLIDSSKIFSDNDAIKQYLANSNVETEIELKKKFTHRVVDETEISKLALYDYKYNKVHSVESSYFNMINSDTSPFDGSDSSLYSDYDSNSMNVFLSSLSIEDLINQNPKMPMYYNMYDSSMDKMVDSNIAKIEFSVPIFNSDGTLRANLAVEYDANNLLEILMKYSAIENKQSHLLVLVENDEGEYEINSRTCMEERNTCVDCDKIENELLEMSKTSDVGYIIQQNQLFTYYNVLSKVDSVNILGNQKWVVVNNFDIKQIYSLRNLLINTLESNHGSVVIIILLFSLIASYFLNKIRNNEDEINLARMVAVTTNDSVFILDHKLRMTFVNKSFERLLGYNSKDLLGASIISVNVDVNNPLMNKETWKSIVDDRTWSDDIWVQKINGLYFPTRVSIYATDNNGSEKQFIGIISDLTLNDSNSIPKDNSERCNSKIIHDILSKNIIKNHKYALLYIGIENHRDLVDIFATEKVDIIDTIVSILHPHIGSTGIIAKTGEYIINVLVNLDNIEESESVYVKKIHDLLSKSVKCGKQDIFFKINTGISLYPYDTEDVGKLFKNSFVSYEWNSLIGTSDFSIFNQSMNEDINREKLIVSHLRHALERNEFFMNYQPQVDIQKGCVVGIEALIRWKSDSLGYISPAEFIPIAEKNHLMSDLGKWIIERVCSDLKHIYSNLIVDYSSFRCAINVSAKQLDSEDFLEHFYRAIKANDLRYENIEIEITENSFLDQIERTKPILDDISSRGITIAIDDFGTGYSSLSYLNRIPIDKIKIDRGFIKDYPHKDDGKLTTFLVKMSKTLKKEVLTEGSETKEQTAFLKNIGCQFIQGYYYSKPLSIDETIEFINTFDFEKF
jgi:PAS domain S-box-containing protein